MASKTTKKKLTPTALKKALASVKAENENLHHYIGDLQRKWALNAEAAEQYRKGKEKEREAVRIAARGLEIERQELLVRAERLAMRINGLGFEAR